MGNFSYRSHDKFWSQRVFVFYEANTLTTCYSSAELDCSILVAGTGRRGWLWRLSKQTPPDSIRVLSETLSWHFHHHFGSPYTKVFVYAARGHSGLFTVSGPVFYAPGWRMNRPQEMR